MFGFRITWGWAFMAVAAAGGPGARAGRSPGGQRQARTQVAPG